LRVKPCVVDWNGDGKLDLLVGDLCGSFSERPQQTPQEIAEEKKANDRLPELRQKWTAAFQQFRAADSAAVEESARAAPSALPAAMSCAVFCNVIATRSRWSRKSKAATCRCHNRTDSSGYSAGRRSAAGEIFMGRSCLFWW